MIDYTWLRCGTRWHAFVRADLHPVARSTSACRQAHGYRTYPSAEDVSEYTHVCANCLRVVERDRVAREHKAKEQKSRPAARRPKDVCTLCGERYDRGCTCVGLLPGEKHYNAWVAESVRGYGPPFSALPEAERSLHARMERRLALKKSEAREVTTLVASRIAVRELRDELKAIEEGLSRRFVLAYRKLDTLEQVFEELAKEVASS